MIMFSDRVYSFTDWIYSNLQTGQTVIIIAEYKESLGFVTFLPPLQLITFCITSQKNQWQMVETAQRPDLKAFGEFPVGVSGNETRHFWRDVPPISSCVCGNSAGCFSQDVGTVSRYFWWDVRKVSSRVSGNKTGHFWHFLTVSSCVGGNKTGCFSQNFRIWRATGTISSQVSSNKTPDGSCNELDILYFRYLAFIPRTDMSEDNWIGRRHDTGCLDFKFLNSWYRSRI